MKEYTQIDWLNRILPQQLPDGWQVLEARNDGCSFVKLGMAIALPEGSTVEDALATFAEMALVVTAANASAYQWIHAVLCARDRRPTIDEVEAVKDGFFDPQTYMSVALFPQSDRERLELARLRSVHLFGCNNCRVLPSFDSGLIIGGFDFADTDLVKRLKKDA